MRCPSCGTGLGDGLLPARCPRCGKNLANVTDAPAGAAGARRAAASRASVEGISGKGHGRRERSFTVKRVVRILAALVMVAAFCALLYVAAYRGELIGGVTVPDVEGWRAERAQADLEDLGFATALTEDASSDMPEGMVESTSPAAGTRAQRGSTVTVTVSS